MVELLRSELAAWLIGISFGGAAGDPGGLATRASTRRELTGGPNRLISYCT